MRVVVVFDVVGVGELWNGEPRGYVVLYLYHCWQGRCLERGTRLAMPGSPGHTPCRVPATPLPLAARWARGPVQRRRGPPLFRGVEVAASSKSSDLALNCHVPVKLIRPLLPPIIADRHSLLKWPERELRNGAEQAP